MRLVKIKLVDCPFWFLGKLINLTKQNPISDFINVDSLPNEEKTVINLSSKTGAIQILDPDNRRLKTIDDAYLFSGEYAIDTGDIEDDESDTVPEVFSVTIKNEEEEEEEERPVEVDYDNARLLLHKNGNTVKKTIKEIPKTQEGLLFLHACLEIEQESKNRAGIINVIQQCIMES